MESGECPMSPAQVLTYSALCVAVTQRFIKQTLPFPKIHIETIFEQMRETERLSRAVTGVWSSARVTRRRRVRSLASGALKGERGRGDDVGCRTRAKDCQKTRKEETEMIERPARPPGTPRTGLNAQGGSVMAR